MLALDRRVPVVFSTLFRGFEFLRFQRQVSALPLLQIVGLYSEKLGI